jgi:hypothetical protein
MTTEVGVLADDAASDPRDGFEGISFSRTTILSRIRSTRQAEIESRAGARKAWPVRKLKQA